MTRTQRVLILGAGFAGVHAYKELHNLFHTTKDISITLVNDGDRFVFTPLIHEVATGTLLPSGVMEPLRTLPQCCLNTFFDAKVEAIDFDKQRVTIRRNRLPDVTHAHGHVPREDIEVLEYDYLISGLGSETNFYNVPGAKEYGVELKSLNDAKHLKNRIIESFEKASDTDDPDEQRAMMTYVVVGGGATGVEVAGEIADFVTGELGNAFPKLKNLPRIVIIERGDSLLSGVDSWFGERARKILKKKADVYHMYKTAVTEVTSDGVATDKGFVHGHTVIWTAGVKAREVTLMHTKPIDIDERSRRTHVTNTLNLASYPNAFFVGDQAWICDKEKEQPYPMRAQFAVREGATASRNIFRLLRGKPLEEFYWRDRGFIVSLGKGGALAEVFGMKLSGPLAWLMYRFAYLSGLISWRVRLRTILEWLLNLFLPRDVSKL